MTSRFIVLALVTGLYANEVDEFDFDGDFYSPIPEKVWSLNISSRIPSDSTSARWTSLMIARDFRKQAKSVDFWARLELGMATYIVDDMPLYAIEPMIDLGAYGEWSETDISVWVSHEVENSYTYFGAKGQSLLRLAHWQGGRIMLGPTIEYSETSTAQTNAGGLLQIEHFWDVYGFSHGPQFRVVGNADLTSSTTSTGKGNSTMNTWSSSFLDIAYKVNWLSQNRDWDISSNLGYSWTMGAIRTSMRQSQTQSSGGLWADAKISRWW